MDLSGRFPQEGVGVSLWCRLRTWCPFKEHSHTVSSVYTQWLHVSMRTTYGFCYWRTLSNERDDEVYLPLDFGRCPLKMVQFEGKSTCRRCDGKNIICRRVERFVDDVAQAEMVFNVLLKIHGQPVPVRPRTSLRQTQSHP